MTSCWMNFAIIIQWIYFTIWEKIKKNIHHYNTILSVCNIKTLQEEFAKKSNIPWIWRIIYGHKLPYMKKTRKKKQVCGAACFMAAEIKFSKDVRPSIRLSVRHFIAATAIRPPKAACQFAADDILLYEFCYYNPMDLLHHLGKDKEES